MRPVRVYLFALIFLWLAPHCCAQVRSQATLIEADLDGCYADCPIIPLPNYYVFCFRAGDKLLIGGHESWDFGLKKLASLEGNTLPLRYDQAHLWVKLPSGWQVKLNQYPFEYSFRDKACRAQAQMRSFERGYTRPAPVPGEPATPVMHGEFVFGWALCSSASNDGLTECTIWDLNGDIRRKGTFMPFADSGLPAASQGWNDATDGTYRIIHLRNGRTLKLIDLTIEQPRP
jgi:hypothetical protein